MAEEAVVEQTVAVDETEARSMGWVPEDEWKGPVEKWVPADEFVRRGQEIMPILRQNNKQLKAELQALQRANSSTAEQLRAVNASLKALQDNQALDAEANETARQEELLSDLKDAIREDDADRQADILKQLTAKPKARVESRVEPLSPPTVDPETQAFISENTWYGQDLRRTALMNGIAAEMRQANSPLRGREFLEAVKAELDKTLGGGTPKRESKVESSRGGASSADHSSGAASRYGELPRDARSQCDKDAPAKFPTRRYKDLSAYRNSWAELYFSQG